MWYQRTASVGITHDSYPARVLAKQRIGPHNQPILSIIFGTLLGDSSAEKRSNSTRIAFQQEDSNVQYLLYLWKLVNDRGYTSDTKPELKERIGSSGHNCVT